MNASGEVIGSIVEGALAGRAVEPSDREAGAGHTHETACLNCGTSLIGPHCHQCGQAAHVHKTLGAFFHDLLHGVFHFEGKIWRTLPMLILRPGRLTREYIDGRRASYVSPIALFLFSIFLMFAVIKQFGGSLDELVKFDSASPAGLAAQKEELAKLEQRRAALIKAGKPLNGLEGQIAGRAAAIENAQNDLQKIATGVHSDVPAVQKAIKEVRENPALGLYKLQSNAYKFSWALIPISVPFVWLLFLFSRQFRLYDHTVFVTYSLCFMTLMATALTLLGAAGAGGFAALSVLIVPLHMYRQVRGTYSVSRFGGLWRMAALLFVALTALILFMIFILAETAA